MRSARYLARIRDKKNAHKILVGKTEEKTPFGRPRVDGDIIKIDLSLISVWTTHSYLMNLAVRRGGANINLTFQIKANFSQPYTAYQ